MPVEVEAVADLALSKGQHRTVFRNPRGLKRYYAFYHRQSYDAGTYGNLYYEYSSNGINWEGKIKITGFNSHSYGEVLCFDVKMRDDGSQLVIYIIVVGYDGVAASTILRYKRGTVADASSTISWGADQNIDASIDTDLPGPHCAAIARTDNGRLVVAFTEGFTTKGKDYRLTKLIGSDGDGASPSWSGETTWGDPSGNSNNQDKDQVWFGLESFNSSYPNRVLIFARTPSGYSVTAYEVRTAVPEWNGTVFSNLLKDYPTSIPDPDQGKVISALIDENDVPHLLWYKSSSDHLRHNKSQTVGDDDWGKGISVQVKSNDVDACTLVLDTEPATDELYAFYHDTADAVNFHYKKTPVDTISWGSEQTITLATDMIALTSWSRQVEDGLHIGIEDADTDVWYHEVDVSGAPPPEGQPAIIRTIGIPTGPGSRTRPGGWN